MTEVSREIVIRVDAPPHESDPDKALTHFYSLDALLRMAYRWGRADQRATDMDLPLVGEGEGWTVGGLLLDTLRDDNSSPRRD